MLSILEGLFNLKETDLPYMRLDETMQRSIVNVNLRGMVDMSCRTQSRLNDVIGKGQPGLEHGLKRGNVGKEFLAHSKNSNFCLMNEHDGKVILSILCVCVCILPFCLKSH